MMIPLLPLYSGSVEGDHHGFLNETFPLRTTKLIDTNTLLLFIYILYNQKLSCTKILLFSPSTYTVMENCIAVEPICGQPSLHAWANTEHFYNALVYS